MEIVWKCSSCELAFRAAMPHQDAKDNPACPSCKSPRGVPPDFASCDHKWDGSCMVCNICGMPIERVCDCEHEWDVSSQKCNRCGIPREAVDPTWGGSRDPFCSAPLPFGRTADEVLDDFCARHPEALRGI